MDRPVVASYCTTFLKREMLHIHRQITGLTRYQTFVLTKSRENAELFPFDDVEVLPRPRINFIARFWKKYIRRLEPVFYRGEYDQLDSVLTRRNAALLHVYFGHTGVHLLPFLRNWPRPSVVSFHGADVQSRPEEPDYDRRLRELLQTVPLVLARSQSLAARLAELGCPTEKIRINRTGIPFDLFPFRQRHAPPGGQWLLVQVCRFIAKKGLDDTLRAFAIFHRAHPRSRLILAGGGPLEKNLRGMAASLSLPVEFPGFLGRAELTQLLASAHIFLHPSKPTASGDREGVPNAMLEAMASGLPVAATLHGGIPEAVEDGTSGLLVPEADPEALAGALSRMAADPGLYARLSENAARSVRERFDIRQTAARLEEFYDELAAARPAGNQPG
ncbi:MAG: glycosyltransferase [Terrimicrobiaceae bacterium]|nr:glycosyltransferase [Terrimicrobiaceae bacterium]